MSDVRKWESIFAGITIGNLATSIAFYLAFDKWQPMVWSAGLNALWFVVVRFVCAMSEAG
jgi:hypothetical protein